MIPDLPDQIWFLVCEQAGPVIKLRTIGPFSSTQITEVVCELFTQAPQTDFCYVCDREPDMDEARATVTVGEALSGLSWTRALCVNETKRTNRSLN